MKETVPSAKTSGTARKRFEVIVEVINPPPIFFFFFYAVLFSLSQNLFVRGAGHTYIYGHQPDYITLLACAFGE